MLGFDSYFITLSSSVLDQKIRLFSSRILLASLPVFLKYKENSEAGKEIKEINDLLYERFILQLKSENIYEEYLLISNLVLAPDYNFLIKNTGEVLQDADNSLRQIFNKTIYNIFKIDIKNKDNEGPTLSTVLDLKTGLSSDQIISKISTKSFISLILEKYDQQILSNGIPDKDENDLLNNMLLKLINFDEET